MANLVYLPNNIEITDNIVPTLYDFDNDYTYATVGTGTAENIVGYSYTGTRSLRINNLDAQNTDFVVSLYTTPVVIENSGYYNLSFYIQNGVFDDGDVIQLEIYKDAVLFQTWDLEPYDPSVTLTSWKRYGQTFNVGGGSFDFTFKITMKANALSSSNDKTVIIDGFKIELNDKNIWLPTAYTSPVQPSVADQIGTGWASYSDTTYVVGAPFAITEGVTSTLPNNAGTVIDTYLPSGVTEFYDQATSKITPDGVGDYYNFAIRFKAKNSNIAGYFDFGIDVGGSLGIIFKETQLFLKGANTEQSFSITCSGYSLDTFVANGGLVKITATLGNLSIYDIQYQINRTFKA